VAAILGSIGDAWPELSAGRGLRETLRLARAAAAESHPTPAAFHDLCLFRP
jgi:hypothetical protein